MINTSRAYINGYSLIPGGRHYEKGLKELFAEAILKSIEAAGNPRIGAVYVANAFAEVLQDQGLLGVVLSDYVGLRGIPSIRVEGGDGSGGLAIVEAYNSVRASIYDCVAVVGVEKMHDATSLRINRVLSILTDYEYEGYFGVTPAAQSAMAMREYMARFGYDYEDLAIWPIKMHERGSNNPVAYMRRQITLKDIVESEVISEPLRLYDMAPPTDGAASVVLCNKPNSGGAVIEVMGVGVASGNPYLGSRETLVRLDSVARATEAALGMAGVSLERINAVEVHDVYSILGILSLESMGVAKQGEAPRLLSSGQLDAGGKTVVNADGGLKCMGFPGGASGVYQLVSMAMQLSGEKPFESLGNLEYGLVQDMGGFDLLSTVIVMRRVS